MLGLGLARLLLLLLDGKTWGHSSGGVVCGGIGIAWGQLTGNRVHQGVWGRKDMLNGRRRELGILLLRILLDLGVLLLRLVWVIVGGRFALLGVSLWLCYGRGVVAKTHGLDILSSIRGRLANGREG